MKTKKHLMVWGLLSFFSMSAVADVTVTMYLTKTDSPKNTTDITTTNAQKNTTDKQVTTDPQTTDTKKPVEKKESIGTITFTTSAYGLMMEPNLHGLTPGMHGIHIHEKPSCDDQAKAAGNHLDPNGSNQHNGPYQASGHLGDLPGLYVDANGDATHTILAPRLQESDLYGHTIIIHAGGDNYADSPVMLGGGGAHFACGVIKKMENNE